MTQISVNYAVVLYEMGISKEDIIYSMGLFKKNDMLYKQLVSPVVALKQKYAVIDKLFPDSMKAFFKVLCKNQSISLINEIFCAYQNYADEHEGRLRVKFFYVEMPKESQIEKIKAYLLRRFQKKEAVFEWIYEPKLLAGFVIEAAGVVIDESAAGKLAGMKQKLVKR